MRKLISLILCLTFTYVSYGQTLQGILDSTTTLYSGSLYLEASDNMKYFGMSIAPDYKYFTYEEVDVIRDYMEFDVNVTIYNYDRWSRFFKAQYHIKDSDKSISISHKDGTESEYTTDEFKKYLWPEIPKDGF